MYSPLYVLVPEWVITFAITLTVIILAVGIPGNALLIITLKRGKKRSSTDIYIICLAGSYIATMVFLSPVELALLKPGLWAFIGSDLLCRLHFFVYQWMFLFTSALVFTIGCDRYFKVYKPHSAVRMKATSKNVCVAEFVISGLISVPFLFTTHENGFGQCMHNLDNERVNVVFYIVMNVVTAACSAHLAWCYFRIAVYLKGRDVQVKPLEVRRDNTIEVRPSKEIVSNRVYFLNIHGNEMGIDQHPSTTNFDFATASAQLPCTSASQYHRDHARAPQAISALAGRLTRKNTNLTMFLASLVFVLTTVLPSAGLAFSASATVASTDVNTGIFFLTRLPLVCYVANPVLFTITSSKYRKNVALVLKHMCKRGTEVTPK